MTFAIVLIVLVVASVLFHVLSPWEQTPLASNWSTIDDTLLITALICGVFFIGIILFMAWAVMRYRHREGQRAHYEPENKKLEWWLIGITTVGICGMLAPGLVVYGDFVRVPKDAALVEVLGQQWRWSYRLPGDDGVLGTADIRHMNGDNPFGLNPDDPDGQDDILVLSNDLHVPVDRPVKVVLRSRDVLHDFYVPHFRVKMDLVPGMVSYFWFTPSREGRFEVLCAELCGVGHYNMRGHVTVDSAETYAQWLTQQPTFAETLTGGSSGGLAEQGKQLAQSQGCLACHSIDGSRGLAPTWKNLYGSERKLADGSTVSADDDYIKESITQPQAKQVADFPPVMVAYPLSPEQLDALVAYIRSLSESGADAGSGQQKGQQVAETQGCFACHSTDGSPRVGPTFQDLYGKSEALADGGSAIVDDAYIRESITQPSAKVVKGYAPVMQPYPLDDEQLDALVALIQSLATNRAQR